MASNRPCNFERHSTLVLIGSLQPYVILLVGSIGIFGAFMSVCADLFSGWSNAPNQMHTALSIEIDSIRGLYLEKPRWTFVLGTYLGVLFIPLQLPGFWLVSKAIEPAGKIKARVFLFGAIYVIALGAGFHGTFAFIGDTIQSGDEPLLKQFLPYWSHWGLVVIAGYLVLCTFLLGLILTNRTLYPRWSSLLTPIPVLFLTGLLTITLPETAYGARAFFTVTGLNLPIVLLLTYTTWHLRNLASAEKSP